MIAAVNQVLKNPDLSRIARKGVRFDFFFGYFDYAMITF